jgi:acyl-CoA dehydrogenase
MPERQAKARAAGLWNPGLPDLADDEPGTRLTNFDYVPLVKIAVPNLLQTIADRAIQVFGAMGGSDDAPIHQALAWARLLRIGDGPDEVHYRQIFKMEAPAPWSVEQSPYLIPRPD